MGAISDSPKWRIVTALLFFVSFSGITCKPTEETQNTPGSTSAATSPYDLQFIDTMTAHHQGAIDMAMMAETNAEHPELKTFGKKIVEDQQREIAQLKQWRNQWYPDQPKAENMEMPGMMDSMKGMDMGHMKGMSGADFDRMFLDMMIPHHQGAIIMAKDALSKAEHAEIKKLAQQIIDAQQEEIETMNNWKAKWSGNG